MVGDVPVHSAPSLRASGRPAFEVRELRGPGLGPLSLTVHAGEIVGFVCREGYGIDTLLPRLGGAAPLEGATAVSGRRVRLSHPADALPDWSTCHRITSWRGSSWTARRSGTLLRRRSDVARLGAGPARGWLGRLARDRMAQVSVRPSVADTPVRHLSGSNQQRVLFGRSLEQAPVVLLLSDPTRGVDVRAKSEIHKLIENLATDGIAVCLTCSGIDEVLAIAQRIVCMRARRIVADGPRGMFDEARALAIVSSRGLRPRKTSSGVIVCSDVERARQEVITSASRSFWCPCAALEIWAAAVKDGPVGGASGPRVVLISMREPGARLAYRLTDVLEGHRRSEVDWEIARVLAPSGGRLTDSVEREIMQKLSASDWSLPH